MRMSWETMSKSDESQDKLCLTAKSCQLGQALLPLHKPLLATADDLLVFHMFRNALQDDVLHHLPEG